MAKQPAEPTPPAGQLSFLESELQLPLETVDDVATISGPNTRVRAGNAMERARAAAISGAIAVLAKHGAKALTMAEVADEGGLARATLYNHVRDKQSLFQLVIGHEARVVATLFANEATLPKALTRASQFIAEHPALVGVRTHDPLSLAPIAVPTAGEGWNAIRELTRQALVARGSKGTPAQVDVLLRWLTSFVVEPSDAASRSSQASAVAKSLH